MHRCGDGVHQCGVGVHWHGVEVHWCGVGMHWCGIGVHWHGVGVHWCGVGVHMYHKWTSASTALCEWSLAAYKPTKSSICLACRYCTIKLRRQMAVVALTKCTRNTDHLLHNVCVEGARPQHLNSRYPFNREAHEHHPRTNYALRWFRSPSKDLDEAEPSANGSVNNHTSAYERNCNPLLTTVITSSTYNCNHILYL